MVEAYAEYAASKHVLLVEDNTDLREFLVMLLGDAGYAVTDVEDGHAALPLIATGKYEIFLVDLQLPDVKGSDLIEKARRYGVSFRAILMSANPEIERFATACHAEGFFFKGEPIQQLLAALQPVA
ncbi:MAG TPA: response regulator [Armatimonadota bacterium]|jgi:DNA-binding response OmpR family regulator